ncbi:MAG: TolC family protein [Gammaproteobacteria bacterium]
MSVFNRGDSSRKKSIAVAVLLWCPLAAASAAGIDLDAAESLALERDARLAGLAERRQALQEDAVAVGQLPDPEMRLGALNLPVDSFALDQEPMTQVQVGLRQRFPRGHSRALNRDRMEILAQAESDRADARRRDVVRALRRAWTERARIAEATAILRDQQQWFAQLEEAVTSAYAAGRRQQQDLLRIAMERDLLEEDAVRLHQLALDQDATLRQLLGDSGIRADVSRLPVLPLPPDPQQGAEALARHPLILAELRQVEAGSVGVEIAQQDYRPAWALDVAYGFREGRDNDGDQRPDFFSAMISFDLPLFRSQRQDRKVASANARESEQRSRLQDLQRQLMQQFQAASGDWESLDQRLRLFEQRVMPAADATVQATRQAYRNDVAPFDELVRAEKTVLDARTRLLRLKAERLQTQADLLYLTGDTP